MIRIKELRQEKGLTQKKLADMLSVADSTLGYWEKGRYEPDTETLQKLADIFGVSVDYLLGRTDIKNKPSAESEELAENEIVIRGRDGRYVRKKLSDDQIKALQMMVDQLPDVSDDI